MRIVFLMGLKMIMMVRVMKTPSCIDTLRLRSLCAALILAGMSALTHAQNSPIIRR